MRAGFHWKAENGREYFVSVVEVTERPAVPQVVRRAWEVRFYLGDSYVAAPLHRYDGVSDLTDEQLEVLFSEAR